MGKTKTPSRQDFQIPSTSVKHRLANLLRTAVRFLEGPAKDSLKFFSANNVSLPKPAVVVAPAGKTDVGVSAPDPFDHLLTASHGPADVDAPTPPGRGKGGTWRSSEGGASEERFNEGRASDGRSSEGRTSEGMSSEGGVQ